MGAAGSRDDAARGLVQRLESWADRLLYDFPDTVQQEEEDMQAGEIGLLEDGLGPELEDGLEEEPGILLAVRLGLARLQLMERLGLKVVSQVRAAATLHETCLEWELDRTAATVAALALRLTTTVYGPTSPHTALWRDKLHWSDTGK